jgi:hypothetical protein
MSHLSTNKKLPKPAAVCPATVSQRAYSAPGSNYHAVPRTQSPFHERPMTNFFPFSDFSVYQLFENP